MAWGVKGVCTPTSLSVRPLDPFLRERRTARRSNNHGAARFSRAGQNPVLQGRRGPHCATERRCACVWDETVLGFDESETTRWGDESVSRFHETETIRWRRNKRN